MNTIRYIIREEIRKFLADGLIKSIEPKKAVDDIINKNFSNLGKATLMRNEMGIDFLLKIKNTDKLKEVMSLVNNIGYFIASYKIGDITYRFNDENFINIIKDNLKNAKLPVTLHLEAKFDKKEESIPKIVFHITSEEFIEKIKKFGLIPKSKSKKSYHPERIYLALEVEAALSMAAQIQSITEREEYFPYLISIDTTKLKDVKFYIDPNFSDYGVYVLENIPKKAIVQIEKIDPEELYDYATEDM